MILFLLISYIVLCFNNFFPTLDEDNLTKKNGYDTIPYECNFLFSGEKISFAGGNPMSIYMDFSQNNGTLAHIDKDSFLFLYRDKHNYSNMKCYYKDKNYVYGYYVEGIGPLFTGFDYKSLKILTGYYFDDSINKLVKNSKDNPFSSETCVLGGCFIDKDNIYVSEGLASDAAPFLGRWKKIKKPLQ